MLSLRNMLETMRGLPSSNPTDLKKRFVPQPDITAYEVAFILGKITGFGGISHEIRFTKEKWDGLELQYKRHFID